jgi:hypothetical protein
MCVVVRLIFQVCAKNRIKIPNRHGDSYYENANSETCGSRKGLLVASEIHGNVCQKSCSDNAGEKKGTAVAHKRKWDADDGK